MSLTTPNGMRRTKTGSLIWQKIGHVKPETPMPSRTMEALAGCRVVGLTYWSDAPPVSSVWAVDDDQQPHLVHLDRNATVAQHKTKCCLGCTLPDDKANWR